MPRVRCFSVSLDRYSVGSNQDLDHPTGIGGLAIVARQFATRTRQRLSRKGGGAAVVENDLLARSFDGIRAWIGAVSPAGGRF